MSDLRGGRAFLASELSQSGWLDFGAFRWADVSAGQGVRAALGVMAPLIIGVATGKIEYGSYAALGALPAGFVSLRGVSWTRILAVLAATAGMAVSTFAGATAAWSQPWLLVPIVFVWAYSSGLFGALGPTVVAVTLQWPVALLIGSAIPLAPGPAAVRAALVLAGGLWQCMLVITSWTVTRGSAERTAVAGSYHVLAGYAAGLAGGHAGPPPPEQFPASSVLADPNPLMRTAARQHLVDLAEEADRIRSTLTALAISQAAEDSGPTGRNVLEGTAGVLTELAASIEARRRQRADHLEAARREVHRISPRNGTSWQWADEALLGQLRNAGRTAERLNDAERVPAAAGRPPRVQPGWIRDARLTLRASLGTSSEAGRHALRLAVVTATTELIARLSGLSHGYWAVLTIFIVLRPDYSSTLYRGLQRAAGTVAGAGLGVATVLLARVSPAALLAGIAVSLVAAYAVFTVNYLLYAVFLTDFVVVLLHLLGLPAGPTAIARLIGTAIGTGLAVLAYLLWPTWEGTSAAEKLARLFAAQGAWASAQLRAYTMPEVTEALRTGRLQLAARRARTDAVASVDRLTGEPVHGPVSVGLAQALISAAHRIAEAGLTLRAAAAAHHVALAKAMAGYRRTRILTCSLALKSWPTALARRRLSSPLHCGSSAPVRRRPGSLHCHHYRSSGPWCRTCARSAPRAGRSPLKTTQVAPGPRADMASGKGCSLPQTAWWTPSTRLHMCCVAVLATIAPKPAATRRLLIQQISICAPSHSGGATASGRLARSPAQARRTRTRAPGRAVHPR
jgi:uncharacterized membrane protein YccC